jgi:cell division protein FtsB
MMKKNFLSKIPFWIRNKYTITTLAFLIWLAFFDRNDLYSQYTYRQQLKGLEVDRDYYRAEIEKNKHDMEELMSDPDHLEKYARERYLMKRDNEDIFLIVEDSTKTEE